MSAPSDSPQRPERRSGERTEVLGGLRGEVMVYQPMSIWELSHSGAQVETSFPLQIDSLHEVRLEVGDASVIVKGRVVHCGIVDVDREYVAYRSGLEFIQPTSGIRDLIARFIDATRVGRLAR
jgi:hypothetical protein